MIKAHELRLKYLGIDTYKEPVIYMHADCPVCKAEGFESQGRILVTYNGKTIIATLNKITTNLLKECEVGFSEYAWKSLNATEGELIQVSHPLPIKSLSYVRSKIYGHKFNADHINEIIKDIVSKRYSNIEVASFVTACAGNKLDEDEMTDLTQAMINAGERITWDKDLIVDKHSVGGLPGNRTTPIIVPIVAAFGLTMPKTSSRAITSPAGTADAMEVIAPVTLDTKTMRQVVDTEGACIIWGGAVSLSPADDLLIRIEKILDLDSEGQLVASVLSKKITAGSTHVVIDMPIGPTAKVRSRQSGEELANTLATVGKKFGLTVVTHFSDGSQPVGRGIGPALEARDVMAVLRCDKDAPQDLRIHALNLAAEIIEFSPQVSEGEGFKIAEKILDSGQAWAKFQAICAAQGGMNAVIPEAQYKHTIVATKSGTVMGIDNRRIARVAKLAGAPRDKVAGVDLHVRVGDKIQEGQGIFTIHADTPGELHYVLYYLHEETDIIQIG